MSPARDVTAPWPSAPDTQAGLPLEIGIARPWTPPSALSVDPWMVLRLSRFRDRQAVPPAIWDATRAMVAHAATLAEPRALFRPTRIARIGDDRVRLDGGSVFTGQAISRLLEGCPLAVPFVLTLGPRLEAEVAALGSRRDLLEAFLLDTAGWATIEVAVRALRLHLAARVHTVGWRVTHRLAPGYQDWPLEEQRELLGALGDGRDLVRLSPHGVLVPLKSITGCFGVAPASGAPSTV